MKRALFFLVLATVLTGGCITDSDDNSGGKSSIVGAWKGVKDSGDKVIFRSDGTYVTDIWESGTYTTSGGKLVLTESGSNIVVNLEFMLSDNFLTIIWIREGNTYYYDYLRMEVAQ